MHEGSISPSRFHPAAGLLVTRVCPVYLVKERCYFGGIYCHCEGGELGKVRENSELGRWEVAQREVGT